MKKSVAHRIRGDAFGSDDINVAALRYSAERFGEIPRQLAFNNEQFSCGRAGVQWQQD